jgi:hypothetical protein
MQDSSHTAQRFFAVCVLILAITLLLFADTELKWKKGASFHLQPGFWSVVALSGMLFFALLKIAQPPWKIQKPDFINWKNSARDWFGPLEFASYFLVYVYLVPWLGYLPSTLLVFPLLVLRAGYRSGKYLALSWVVGIVIVVLFKSLLQVKIPGGELYGLFPEAIRNFLVLRF